MQYILFVRNTRCRSCGTLSTSSELFITDVHERIRKMKPALDYTAGTPVECISIPTRTTPLCHTCIGTAPTPDFEAATRWSETLRRKRDELRAAETERAVNVVMSRSGPKPARPAKEVTLDDLI